MTIRAEQPNTENPPQPGVAQRAASQRAVVPQPAAVQPEAATPQPAVAQPEAATPQPAAAQPVAPQSGIDYALLNTDGGSRGNPGQSGIGFVINVDNGRELEVICQGGAYIGVTTNNVAEYRALIWGLQNARVLGIGRLEVLADSELVVKQLNGAYRVKNEGIKPLYREAKNLMDGFTQCVVRHVPRAQNAQADRLANEAMDSRGLVGDYCVAYETGDLFKMAAQAPAAQATAAQATADMTAATATPVAATAPAASTPAAATAQAAASAPAAAAAQAAPAPSASPTTAPNSAPQQKGSTMTEPIATGTYALTVREHFDAAHALVGYPGKCRNLHGHTWDVDVTVKGTKLDSVGIVYDFVDIKKNLLDILDQFDHKYLNEVPPFDQFNSTAENLARVIYDQMEAVLPEGIDLVEISVWESPIAKLTYTR